MKVNSKIENAIIRLLMERLNAKSYVVHSVLDSDGDVEDCLNDNHKALKLIFNLDDAALRFVGPNDMKALHWVVLVLGTGPDVISNWSGDSKFGLVVEGVVDCVLNCQFKLIPCPGDIPAWANRDENGNILSRGACINCGEAHEEHKS
jgi:hypothetical protein